MASLDDIKSRFIIDDREYETAKVAAVIEMANRYIKVSKAGRVLFERVDLVNKDRVALVFIGRFLGSILDSNIKRDVSNDEISEMTGIDPKQVSARITDLSRAKLVERSGPSSHKVTGMFAVERYLQEIRRGFEA